MKILLLFTCFLLNNVSYSCGYYPYGEDIRFSLMNPLVFGYRDYQPYNYTASLLYPDENIGEAYFETIDSLDFGKIANAKLWGLRCNQNVTQRDILAAIYGNVDFKKLRVTNSFIKDLYLRKDIEALKYLEIARKCAVYNKVSTDPWETQPKNVKVRNKLILSIIGLSNSCKDASLKKRYAFLAIRLSYYAGNSDAITKLYASHFDFKGANKTIVDYWALYFRALIEENPFQKNLMSAVVFANAADKRFMIRYEYDTNIDMTQTLALATTNEEKEAVYLLQAIMTPSKCLDYIRLIQQLNPNSRNLSFLLLREVNKLEDWILTPSYTRFFPAAGYGNYYAENQTDEDQYLRERVVEDRIYAKELLNILGRINISVAENKDLVNFLSCYAAFLSENNVMAVRHAEALERSGAKTEILVQANYIKALALTANLENDKVKILKEIEPIIALGVKEKNAKFLFALGREFQLKGATALAALFFWKIEETKRFEEGSNQYNSGLYWKSQKRNQNLGSDFFYEYFHYLDAEYPTNQVIDILDFYAINSNKSEFFKRFTFGFNQEIARLQDLVGTKYMRANDLEKAKIYFDKAGPDFYATDVFKRYLNANPFYTNMFNEH